jgi:FkbM family methyltransferase
MSCRRIARAILSNPGNAGQYCKRLVSALRWQLYKRTIAKPKTITLASGLRFRAYPDCVVSSALIYASWPEYNEVAFCRSRLCSQDVVIDVGANVGHLPLLLGDLLEPTNIFSFEPAPEAFRRLKENWACNGWPEENLFDQGIGDIAGTMFISGAPTPATTNSLRDSRDDRDVAVRVEPLDYSRHLWRGKTIGLLKIDVEGFEVQVFNGACLTISEDQPRLIMFESLDGRPDPRIVTTLSKAGYSIFGLDSSGHADLDDLTGQNLFAAPARAVAIQCRNPN